MKAQTQIEALLLSGPWVNRFVSANGNRFHVAECGTGPLVLFLHGFPDCWWTWRNQLPHFAAAGYRAVAMDLRGYGASDKPPRGYDAYTLAADITGVIRALGERNALLVGHDWGGFLGWSAAAFHPRLVRGLATVGAAHPLLLRRAILRNRRQRSAFSHMFTFQLPR
ncbi:MAG: alpha/beta fold hydrolase, partial [Pseudonocardiaceae bacterium]